MWTVIYAFWVPVIVSKVLGKASWNVFFAGALIVVVVGLIGCGIGTLQARRHRTPLGRVG